MRGAEALRVDAVARGGRKGRLRKGEEKKEEEEVAKMRILNDKKKTKRNKDMEYLLPLN